MKRAVRTLVLVVGAVCTCWAAAAPIATNMYDGPMPLCGKRVCDPDKLVGSVR